MKYTQSQLEQAFQKVQNKNHWKGPIDSYIQAHERDLISAAISHFTATQANFTIQSNGWLRVKAKGYRLGLAGDH